MLVGFSVKNFRSIAATQSVNFLATTDRTLRDTHCVPTRFRATPWLTRMALLFGPNGAGKSNLLSALRVMREFVLTSQSFTAADIASRYMPFFSALGTASPVLLGIDVILDRMRYRYSFSYDATRIVHEELRVFETQKSQRWFGRHITNESKTESWTPFSVSLNGPRETWRRATGSQSLFLSVAARMQAAQFRPLIDWFDAKLSVTRAADLASLGEFAARLSDPAFKRQTLQVLSAVGLPVTDLRVGIADSTSVELLYSRRGQPAMWFDANEDSAGIRRLLVLLVRILDGIHGGRFIAIDEFDAQLHPLIARYLIEFMNQPHSAEHRLQSLLVSHDLALLDLDLVRRDEVWFMEADAAHASRVTGLMDYGPRQHELISKSYLRGRFGAVPKIRAARQTRRAKKRTI